MDTGRFYKCFSKIAMLTPQERLYKRLPVIQESNGHTLIEIGNTLKNFTLFGMEPAYYDMKISMRNKERDRILDVKGKNDCILLRMSRTYSNLAMPLPGKPIQNYQGIWETGVCISLMPKQPISVKRGDGKSFLKSTSLCFLQMVSEVAFLSLSVGDWKSVLRIENGIAEENWWNRCILSSSM